MVQDLQRYPKEKVNDNILLKDYVHRIRGIINEFGEYVPHNLSLEISHHYGLNKIEDDFLYNYYS